VGSDFVENGYPLYEIQPSKDKARHCLEDTMHSRDEVKCSQNEAKCSEYEMELLEDEARHY
ncbi:member of exoprotein family, partial [Lasius niger]